jgi:hypothetical protein
VGDAAGQLADRIEPLRLPEVAFDGLLRRKFVDDSDEDRLVVQLCCADRDADR